MLQDLLSVLRQCDISEGDILYIPSDVTQLLVSARKKYGIDNAEKRNSFLHDIVDTFKVAVGSNGTLMFPIFSWDFNHGVPFNIKSTLGKVGSLPNWILQNRNEFTRTQHPMYSFMVWGKDAKMLTKMNNIDCWGEYSPFGYMHRNNVKALFLNVPVHRGFTFTHYVEESIQVPYRYFKNFQSTYIDINGNNSVRNYVMYVRDIEIISNEIFQDSFFEKNKILKSTLWNDVEIKTMSCAEAYKLIKDDFLNNGGGNIYHFENYKIDWSCAHTHKDEIDRV